MSIKASLLDTLTILVQQSDSAARRAIILSAAMVVLSNCSGPPPPPVTVKEIPASPVVSMQVQSLTPDEMRQVSNPDINAAYVLGPGDVIATQVYSYPELSMPPTVGTSTYPGALVTGDGSIRLPLIGTVQVGGLTLNQAEQLIAQDYSQSIPNANVNVQLVQAQSLRYYLLGAFNAPGIKYPGRPMNLLQALALGGSVDLATADLYQAYVAQGSTKLPVDLHALLADGDLSQNINLASNDIVVIPSASSENAYFFGAVGKPGAEPFASGQLSLLQGLSAAGMDLPSYTAAGLQNVHIIRSGGTAGQLFVVNANAILQGQATSFALQPGDIVFVPPTGWASWNQVLDELLPSLQVIAGVLQPFVSIEYLRRN